MGTHFATSLAYGRDPHAAMRQMLTTGKRGCQFTFDFRRDADFELTLLWRRGDSLATALERLHAIRADPTAGRAPRDSMLPEFEGLDDWVPRPYREALCAAVSSKVIGVERVLLPDGPLASQIAAEHLADRWKPSSPLYRAATAVVHYWEKRGIDPGRCHLHGADIRDQQTPYFAGFGWRYFRSIPACLTRFGGVEWIEVVHPREPGPWIASGSFPWTGKSLIKLCGTEISAGVRIHGERQVMSTDELNPEQEEQLIGEMRADRAVRLGPD